MSNRQPVRARLLVAAVLLLAAALPNLGVEINTFGFYWNFYRIAIVVLALSTLFLYRGAIRFSGGREAFVWMGFLLVWLIYGGILMVVSPYADPHRGLQELLSVLSGLLAIYILTGLSLSDDEIEMLLRMVFVILAGLLVLGFWEISTGEHLATSMFEDPLNKQATRLDTHQATGIMYNMNDFSALITLMCPAVIGRFRIHFRRFYFDPGWILVIGTVLINRTNDANLSSIAIFVGVLIYLWMQTKGNRMAYAKIVRGVCILLGVLLAATIIYGFREDEGFLFNRMMEMVEKTSEETGSLYARSLIYKDAITATAATGFLGLGPAGFPVYYTENQPSSVYINPHGLLPEILSEYGLIICALFVILLIRLFRRMKEIYRNEENEKRREWGRLGAILVVTYLIVSFAPSSYLLMTLHWTLIALLLLFSKKEKEYGI